MKENVQANTSQMLTLNYITVSKKSKKLGLVIFVSIYSK